MKISEIFASIQGEGKLAGTPSVFVRTSFCNLRCRWCDTRYTSWEPEFVTRDTWHVAREAEELAQRNNIQHIVITGGEPFLQAHDLASVTSILKHEGLHVTIETNGTIFYPIKADLFSISPKLSNSVPHSANGSAVDAGSRWQFHSSSPEPGEGGDSSPIHWHDRLRQCGDPLRLFLLHTAGNGTSPSHADREIQFKFVVESEHDLEEIDRLAQTVPIDPRFILLMPQVTSQADLPTAYATVHRMCEQTGYGFSPRLHIERFGNIRGR